MAQLKGCFGKRVIASSLTEVIVATSILLLVFGIAVITLNNIMVNTVQNDTQNLETKIEKMMYQYNNNQLKIPSTYKDKDELVSIEKIKIDGVFFIEFSIKNAGIKKEITKRIFANESN
ncbi:hypothetical protein [Polaribacter cellanae]|uniref:Uncharacterized protein n=1 Tax=Polaribacter cellanae TaxID=2818493 RepID=A0A975CNW3_9FLAO|nr:hypothetical protein [Polaribacter cellanae]QTE21147.1 hypothetical protein J3359_09815 [Polaribacter cellanae]